MMRASVVTLIHPQRIDRPHAVGLGRGRHGEPSRWLHELAGQAVSLEHARLSRADDLHVVRFRGVAVHLLSRDQVAERDGAPARFGAVGGVVVDVASVTSDSHPFISCLDHAGRSSCRETRHGFPTWLGVRAAP